MGQGRRGCATRLPNGPPHCPRPPSPPDAVPHLIAVLALPVDWHRTRIADEVFHDGHAPQRVLGAEADHPRRRLYQAERVRQPVAVVKAQQRRLALRGEVLEAVALNRRVEDETAGLEDEPNDGVEQRRTVCAGRGAVGVHRDRRRTTARLSGRG
eukprot:scaffold22199_cov118-Isochrysis_galbana.AAC.8